MCRRRTISRAADTRHRKDSAAVSAQQHRQIKAWQSERFTASPLLPFLVPFDLRFLRSRPREIRGQSVWRPYFQTVPGQRGHLLDHVHEVQLSPTA
jgi:hypothetical protein